MQSVQISHAFPLSDVKPLDGLLTYRNACLKAVQKACVGSTVRRRVSPVNGKPLESWAVIDRLEYGRCPTTGSLFFTELPSSEAWEKVLLEISTLRNSPKIFHTPLVKSRRENVYAPKVEWIQNTVRLEGMKRPKVMEVVSPPSPFTSLLQESGTFGEVLTVSEMALRMGRESCRNVDVAVLLESLDRVDDPQALLKQTGISLKKGGLLFVTALVSSGFDMSVLGSNNAYLYPPDRTNCFSLEGIKTLLLQNGFKLSEVSTPGVLDLEVVRAHITHYPKLFLSSFEKTLLASPVEVQVAFQTFLQQANFSSFARVVGIKI